MFKNLGLATKLGLGFGAIALIAIVVGLLAFGSMNSVKGTSNILAKEDIPEVSISTNVERYMLTAAYEIRGYTFAEQTSYLEKGRAMLKLVRKSIEEAKKHGESSTRLAELKKNAELAEKKLNEYESLLVKTIDLTDRLDLQRTVADESATKYMKISNAFYESQREGFLGEIRAGMDSDILEKRLKRINFVKEVADWGNKIVSDVWMAQAKRNPNIIAEALKQFAIVNTKLDELKKVTDYEGDLKKIEDVRAAANSYKSANENFYKIWQEREATGEIRQKTLAELLEVAKSTSAKGLDDVTVASKKAASSLTASSFVLSIGLIICLVVSILIGWVITGMIVNPINSIVKRLDDGADQTAAASSQVASASQQLSQGATQQAASLEETSSSLDEMASMTKANADNASKANQLAQEARSNADQGNKAMNEMQTAMTEINLSSDKISKIIKTIEEIAFQTNLLALNAAVEAARAGEHGKGFAVVAEEVRNLARRSADSAKDTAALIEDSINKVKNGTEIAKKAGDSLQNITSGAKKVADIVSEIAAASKEQAEGINQITNAISQMDQVTQQNASVAEESASASEQLTSQASALKGLVVELEQLARGANASSVSFSENKTTERRTNSSPVKIAKVSNKIQSKSTVKINRLETSSHKEHNVLNPEDVIPLDDEKTLKQF